MNKGYTYKELAIYYKMGSEQKKNLAALLISARLAYVTAFFAVGLFDCFLNAINSIGTLVAVCSISIVVNVRKGVLYHRINKDRILPLVIDQISYMVGIISFTVVYFVLYRGQLVINLVLNFVVIVLLVPFLIYNEKIITFTKEELKK